jgi:hypothetical protein
LISEGGKFDTQNYLDFLEEINMLQEFGPQKETPECTYTTALFQGQVKLLKIRTNYQLLP